MRAIFSALFLGAVTFPAMTTAKIPAEWEACFLSSFRAMTQTEFYRNHYPKNESALAPMLRRLDRLGEAVDANAMSEISQAEFKTFERQLEPYYQRVVEKESEAAKGASYKAYLARIEAHIAYAETTCKKAM